jgi:vacuolar-type H+-ATPase subunit I/STV1
MAFPRSGSRGNSAKVRKASSRKTSSKRKAPKESSGIKYAPEVTPPSAKEIAEKTVGSLEKLGSQIFALSPFSQYFDDWLVNLREVVSEFESHPSVKVDEEFLKDRAQIFANVEGELAEVRLMEAELEAAAKELADTNHHVVDLDAEYAAQNKELGAKRNSDIETLTKNVHEIEDELEQVRQMKTSFLFGFTKSVKKKREEEIIQRLNSSKAELEVSVQNFSVEQEKLHDDYQRKKQEAIEKVQNLEKDIVNIETDSSAEVRKAAADGLANAVKSLLQRKEAPPKE